ncbi:MAG: hypothetical protein D6731_16250 [Planctomycetota bacterium]|nr:MAG: hypothetical protein D6731_16250 [Planctomycetota bacterium]
MLRLPTPRSGGAFDAARAGPTGDRGAGVEALGQVGNVPVGAGDDSEARRGHGVRREGDAKPGTGPRRC